VGAGLDGAALCHIWGARGLGSELVYRKHGKKQVVSCALISSFCGSMWMLLEREWLHLLRSCVPIDISIEMHGSFWKVMFPFSFCSKKISNRILVFNSRLYISN
jgi:hypothetical protein